MLKKKKSDTLISVGSLPSNQCKAVAKVACENGLNCHLIYGGDKQAKPKMAQGNYLLTTLYNPKISWFEHSSWIKLSENLSKIFDDEKNNGHSPYIIESGGSAGLGMLGSIELGFEIISQLQNNNSKKYDVVCAAGSGGTAVGIQMAAEFLDFDLEVHGICIGENADKLSCKATKLKDDTYKMLKLDSKLKKSINFYDCGLGIAYDTPSKEELETMQYAINKYGLIFDINYMVKTFIGMKYLIEKEKIRKNSTIILIHSGGQIGLFDNNDNMIEWYCKNNKDYVM